ncbi:MAG: hypothetical protein RBG13Loki_2472 [Promethearchaeota archaeon CR_4]|nr:MAG: hypothetical protein RBG13Loki_2472 [Candidatus Lokiarchaeota archaeon CR_4]
MDFYLANISAFELTHPNTVFVYMTENAQSTDYAGYNRALRNKQIRDYCDAYDKWLFDFEDMDAWCGIENRSYNYESYIVPLQHSAYDCPSCDVHVNEYGSRVKGIALWWMLARIAGWEGTTYDASPCQGGIPGSPLGIICLNMGCTIGLVVVLKRKGKLS